MEFTRELARFTDEQIIDEMHRRFNGRFCCWVDEDARVALKEAGFEDTAENVEAVWFEAGDSLSERMTEIGSEVLRDAVWFAQGSLSEVEEV